VIGRTERLQHYAPSTSRVKCTSSCDNGIDKQCVKEHPINIFEFIIALILIGGAVATAAVVAIVFAVRAIMKWAKKETLGGGKQLYLDQEKGAEPRDIQNALRAYLHARGIGSRARSISNQVKAAQEKQANLTAVVKAKFPEGSISNVKSQSAVDTAYNVILRNCTILSNRINTFDVRDFQALERANSASILGKKEIVTDVQAERWRLMHEAIASMDDIIDANERILLQLDKLAAELALVGLEENEAQSNEMLVEIQTLVDQAKFYQ